MLAPFLGDVADLLRVTGMPEAMDLASGISPGRLALVRREAQAAVLGETLNFPMPQLLGLPPPRSQWRDRAAGDESTRQWTLPAQSNVMHHMLQCSIIMLGLLAAAARVMMPGLGETTAMLARLREASTKTSSTTAGGSLAETMGFGENPGALRMLSYAPSGLSANAPLIVLLHGCAQTAETYAVSGGWIALADRLGFAVLAPEQTSANNPNRCFNWFEPGDTTPGQGEVASIASMVRAMVRARGCDPRRIFITGLSAGGAMTAAMLAAYPELFAGGAIIAGLAYGVARGVPDALRVMGRGDGRAAIVLGALVQRGAAAPLRLSIWQGDADYTVNAANAQDLVRQWTSAAGLAEAPGEVTRLGNRTRSIWRDEVSGSMVELNIIHGLGHGAPLSTQERGDVGHAAPYMLEAGVSSTLEIAAFWGLGAKEAAWPLSSARVVARPLDTVGPEPAAAPKATDVAGQVLDAICGRVPCEVRDVIAKALSAAGLSR